MGGIDWFIILRNLTIFFAALMLFKYWLFLMIAPWYSLKTARLKRVAMKRLKEPYEPVISVVIPSWNEEVGILRTLQSLLDNSYKKIEIIIVNDGSDDSSHELISRFMAGKQRMRVSGKVIKYFYKQNGGKGSALNYGINHARGEIITTMDADSIFSPDAIQNLVPYFANTKIDAVVGNVKIAKNNTLVGHLQQLEYLFGFYFKRAHAVLNAEYIFGGACAAFRRKSTFERFGLFDTKNKTEDIEMSLRTRYYGLKAAYAEDVVCYTEGASNISGLISQRLRWKNGRIMTFGKYRRMFFSLRRHHSYWLTYFVLPYSLFGELQLLFEPVGITLLAVYSLISGDYFSLALGIMFVSITYLVVGLFNQKNIDIKTVLKFPFTWPLFYITTWVEYIVLLKSLKMVIRGEDIVWQKWQRKGVATKLNSTNTRKGVSVETT